MFSSVLLVAREPQVGDTWTVSVSKGDGVREDGRTGGDEEDQQGGVLGAGQGGGSSHGTVGFNEVRNLKAGSAQREEEMRKEEEKKKAAEERQRYEEERMELERIEQENREKRYREREQQIEEHRWAFASRRDYLICQERRRDTLEV